MKGLKNSASLIGAIVLALLFTSCASKVTKAEKDIVRINSDFPSYKTTSDLYEKASLVVEGKVLKSRTELMSALIEPGPEEKLDPKLNPGGSAEAVERPYTVYTIEIKHVYKGNVSEKETLEMKQIGGETDTLIYIDEDAPKIDTNAEYVMFLETYDDSPATLLNDIQSLYKTDNGQLIGHPENTLKLNYEDLNYLTSKKD